MVTRDEVGAYKPYLWEQSTFHNGVLFREWILTKIVNGERASYSAPKFARMQERTRSQMLEDIVANLQNHAETGQIPKPYRFDPDFFIGKIKDFLLSSCRAKGRPVLLSSRSARRASNRVYWIELRKRVINLDWILSIDTKTKVWLVPLTFSLCCFACWLPF